MKRDPGLPLPNFLFQHFPFDRQPHPPFFTHLTMSTPEESAPPTSTTQDQPIDKLASIRERHAKETKQLETKIASLRKSVEKASKAKKREMNSRISDMQSKLQFKHDEEIRKLEVCYALVGWGGERR